jgi:hypothetical protein
MSGNVFKDSNSVVPKELLGLNVEVALRQSNLMDIRYNLIGNIDKPYLGDIDIAMSRKELIEKLDLNPEAFWKELDGFLKENAARKYKIHKGLDAFHLLVPLVDLSGKHLSAIDKEGQVNEDKPGFVQIDIFVGELNWMKNIMCGAPKESQYKANHTHKFLGAIFATLQWPSKKDPTMHYKFTLNPRRGLKIVKRQQTSADQKPKKISEKVFSVNSNIVAKLLFSSDVKWKDINSYEKLYKLIMSNKFRFENQRDKIFNEFKETLIRNKMEIPKEIK